MKEYRAKQQKEEEKWWFRRYSSSSNNNNNIKLLSNETKITCECGICYHKSYKSRHLNSKAHLEGLNKKQEPQEPQEEAFEIDDKKW